MSRNHPLTTGLSALVRWLGLLPAYLVVVACASKPAVEPEVGVGKTLCDSYIIFDMCVRDLLGDNVVDMIYFSDTMEVFMYREGMREEILKVMPIHRCAVVLSEHMQATTNRILDREKHSLSEDLSIKRALIANYMQSKPEIDACNARYEDENPQEKKPEPEFYVEEDEWED